MSDKLIAPELPERKTAPLNVRLKPSIKKMLAKIGKELKRNETDTVEAIILDAAKKIEK